MSIPTGTYVIVRTYSAGVFAGELGEVKDNTVTVTNARRLWYWSGAASLSELAMSGVKKPENCKFPPAVPAVLLRDWIEIIPATPAARTSIEGVKVWTA